VTTPLLASSMGLDILRLTTIVCLGYLLAVYAAYGFMLVVSGLELAGNLRGRRFETMELARESVFTIPVSVIAPVYNEAAVVVAAVRSFLAVDYPEFEVIVVNDGSTDGTLAVLQAAFSLQRTGRLVRIVHPSAGVRGIYTSADHPRLIVVDKENGGKADALNCGLNIARFRYVCGVDGDTILVPSCLLNGMRLVLSDPATIIGVTGHIAISGAPENALGSDGRPTEVERRPLLAFQHLDYVRSFFNNRLGWTRLNTMLCAVGAFQIWRRDVLEEAGGFSRAFTCEDIELTFRLHELMRRERRPYRILSLGETVGVTEGPDRVRTLVAQRERWQRVIMETVFHNRRMFLNPRYGTVGMIGVPFFVLSEVLAPAFEVLALGTLVAGLALGAFDPAQFALIVCAIAFANGLFTTGAIALEDRASRAYNKAGLLRLLLLGPLDLFAYRPLIVYARAKGTWRFLRGDKGWHKFQRNDRSVSAPSA
jgi:poly-beta-1,6-N-acetyl-D-glucosamine synthase